MTTAEPLAARTVARNILMARGFTEGEAVALLCPVIAEAYREVAREAIDSSDGTWGSTPGEALRNLGDAFATSADRLDAAAPVIETVA